MKTCVILTFSFFGTLNVTPPSLIWTHRKQLGKEAILPFSQSFKISAERQKNIFVTFCFFHCITSKFGRLIKKPTKLIDGLEFSDKVVTGVTETQEPDLPSSPSPTEGEEEEETKQGKKVDEEEESSSDINDTFFVMG